MKCKSIVLSLVTQGKKCCWERYLLLEKIILHKKCRPYSTFEIISLNTVLMNNYVLIHVCLSDIDYIWMWKEKLLKEKIDSMYLSINIFNDNLSRFRTCVQCSHLVGWNYHLLHLWKDANMHQGCNFYIFKQSWSQMDIKTVTFHIKPMH